MKSARKKSMRLVTSAVPEVELVSPYIGWFDINYRGWNKAQGFEKLIETIGT